MRVPTAATGRSLRAERIVCAIRENEGRAADCQRSAAVVRGTYGDRADLPCRRSGSRARGELPIQEEPIAISSGSRRATLPRTHCETPPSCGRTEDGVDFDVIAEGLQFPEGPIAMGDGSVTSSDRPRHVDAPGRAAPRRLRTSAAAQRRGDRSDGAVYVCNNGGFEWRMERAARPAGTAKDYTTGRIERVNLQTVRSNASMTRSTATAWAGPTTFL